MADGRLCQVSKSDPSPANAVTSADISDDLPVANRRMAGRIASMMSCAANSLEVFDNTRVSTSFPSGETLN